MDKINSGVTAIKNNSFSFWQYHTHEDKAARNLWAVLMISLGLFSAVLIS